MTQHSDHKSIEQDIQRDRDSLKSTLNALQDRISVDEIARDAMSALRSNAAAYTSSAEQMIRANPMALALTGVGLAWLFFGNKDNTSSAPKRPEVRRWEDEGGRVEPVSSRETMSEAWFQKANSHRERAHDAMARIERKSSQGAASLRGRAEDAAHDLRDAASERAAVAKEFATGLTSSFLHDLEDLSDTAKERIVAAREQAYSAWIDAEKRAQKIGKSAGRMIEDQPLIIGAVACAIGAGIAAALPHTDTEDRVFGRESDNLMRDAKQMLMQERERAMRVAKGVVDEVQSAAKDVLTAAKETAQDAPERVKERAAAEAETKSKS